MSPGNENLAPCLEKKTTEMRGFISRIKFQLSTKPNTSKDTGEKFDYIRKGKDVAFYSSNNNHINKTFINCPKPTDSRIIHNHLFYHCKKHSKFINIHLETIEHHLKFYKDH